MILLALLQIALPLAVIIWLLVWAPANRLGLVLLIVAAMLLLTAVTLIGVWTRIPIWMPYALAGVWLVAVVKSLRQWPRAMRPNNLSSWAALLVALALAGTSASFLFRAVEGRKPPETPPIDLAAPIKGNDLRIANGGSNILVNAHADTLDPSVARHRDWFGQSYGIDIVAIRPVGMTSDSLQPVDPARYAIFGRAVHAPCNGTVIATRNDRPDMPVPQVDREVMTGNFVTLRCAGADVVMAHLQRGSVAVKLGDALKTGDLIGRVGNSGLSDEPHLHMHAQTPGTAAAPHSGRPIPILFSGHFPVRNDRL
jgi:Peptidase family M23